MLAFARMYATAEARRDAGVSWTSSSTCTPLWARHLTTDAKKHVPSDATTHMTRRMSNRVARRALESGAPWRVMVRSAQLVLEGLWREGAEEGVSG